MRQSGYSMWTVKTDVRKHSIIAMNWDRSVSMEASIDRLKNILSNQSGQTIFVELLPKDFDAKSDKKFRSLIMEVDLRSINPQAVSIIPANQVQGLDKLERMIADLAEKNSKLQAELIASKYENKIAELEQRISGPSDDPINRILELVIPIAAAYMQKVSGGSTPVINGLETFDAADPVRDLLAADPEGLAVVAKIASVAVNDPKFYEKLKPMLFKIENYKSLLMNL